MGAPLHRFFWAPPKVCPPPWKNSCGRPCMDDLLVFSDSVTDHEQHLRSVLSLLQNNGLIVRPDKCVFAANAVNFLGHRIDSSGIRPPPSKVKAIEDYPVPTTVKELQAFLGMVNYYLRFTPNAAAHMSPLYAVLSKKNERSHLDQLTTVSFCLHQAHTCRSSYPYSSSTKRPTHPHHRRQQQRHWCCPRDNHRWHMHLSHCRSTAVPSIKQNATTARLTENSLQSTTPSVTLDTCYRRQDLYHPNRLPPTRDCSQKIRRRMVSQATTPSLSNR